MIRTQIQLTEAQAESIRRMAGDKQLSMAEIIRQGVDMLLRAPLVPDHGSRVQRALAAAGRFRSGHTETSEAHDEVLAATYHR